MSRITRIAAIIAVSLLLLVAAIAGVILTVIDPNDYKRQIEAMAFEATGKKLRLLGDLSLSIFPAISIEAGPAIMEDLPSFGSEPFLRVEKVSASVALGPLFKGVADIGSVEISGAHLKLAVDNTGANNWSMPKNSRGTAPGDGGSQTAGKPSALSSIALESLAVTNATVAYVDMLSGTETAFTVKKLTLKNVKIGEKSDLALEAALAGVFTEMAGISLAASFTLPATLAEGTQVTAEGKFAGTPFAFQGFIALPDGVTVKGNASLGAINLDTFAVPVKKSTASGAAQSATTGQTAAPDEKRLAKTLHGLFLDIHMKAESVTVNNIPLQKIEATVKADRGVITAKPVSLDVFGPVTAEASIDARAATIKTRSSGEWKNAAIGPLAKALTGKAPLTGNLDLSWNVNLSGTSWPVASRTLGGKASVTMTNGNIPAFQLIPKGLPGLPAMTLDLTNVTCSSTWNIANGIATNNDLAMRAVALSGTGEGSVSIPAERIDYKMNVNIPTIKELPDLKILPIVVSGPLTAPSYGIDQPAVLRQTVKSVLDPTTKVGKEVEKGLGKALKKLF